MTEISGGDGTALDATVDAVEPTVADIAAVSAPPAPSEGDIAFLELVVVKTQATVERQKEHLAGAELSLAAAQAALAAAKGE